MKNFFLFIAIILCSCSQKVDLIVHNAKIYTSDTDFSIQSSLIVNDGFFIDVGGDDIIKKYSSRNVIDAQGLSIYPGLIDSHSHFHNLGYLKNQLDLTSTKSLSDVIDAARNMTLRENLTL